MCLHVCLCGWGVGGSHGKRCHIQHRRLLRKGVMLQPATRDVQWPSQLSDAGLYSRWPWVGGGLIFSLHKFDPNSLQHPPSPLPSASQTQLLQDQNTHIEESKLSLHTQVHIPFRNNGTVFIIGVIWWNILSHSLHSQPYFLEVSVSDW